MQLKKFEPSPETPIYLPDCVSGWDLLDLAEKDIWQDKIEARRESFQSLKGGISYSYGKGRGEREYTSVLCEPLVADLMLALNVALVLTGFKSGLNACFLNYYKGERNAIGWHSDDFPRMDHEVPIIVCSCGEPREIWWRKIGGDEIGKQLLGHGSVFIMPPNFQKTHEHRIPKGDRKMSPRLSLTFRRFDSE